MCDDHVWACKGEVGSQAGTLGACERIVERLCGALPSKRKQEEAAEAVAVRKLPLQFAIWVEDVCDRQGGGLVGSRGRVQ